PRSCRTKSRSWQRRRRKRKRSIPRALKRPRKKPRPSCRRPGLKATRTRRRHCNGRMQDWKWRGRSEKITAGRWQYAVDFFIVAAGCGIFRTSSQRWKRTSTEIATVIKDSSGDTSFTTGPELSRLFSIGDNPGDGE